MIPIIKSSVLFYVYPSLADGKNTYDRPKLIMPIKISDRER